MSSPDIEQALESFQASMETLGLTLTEEEIEAKRRELEAIEGGETALEVYPDSDVQSFEEAFQATDTLVIDDFVKLNDKSKVINIPFVIQRWWFAEGDMGPFVVARCLLPKENPIFIDGDPTIKFIITDGSTGIYKQLKETTLKTQKTSKLVVRHGLRVSQYTADTDQGPKNAETYYLT